ncbi:glycosyltransferase family 4 protein [Candidatus Puniceispirillum marinum]|uniref:Glycosyl transferase, group 1 n=1 Tax=Puniceispirillum marinum (strain IMCC1322) TaxID=488538 RepID=D5BT82_PUNMI|nr:glycosyltransferase family 4 protein [Candidatus Puniceispirillum marinum]ADE39479.1 Glycosyl transferase, group 1 [Candidatus Puniceispirillum marinum IMCC1322]
MANTPRLSKTNTPQDQRPVIVQILPALGRGGVERGTIEMAQAIEKAGGRAVVISAGGPLERHIVRCGATHHTLPVNVKNPLKWGSIRRRLQKILQDEDADIVHVRSRAPAWIALPVAKTLRIPTVSTVHGRFQAHSIFKRIYNGKIIKVDHVIAISKYVKQLITSQFVGVEERMTVIHRGVDVDVFDPQAVNQTRIINFADSVALPEEMPVVMLPARPTLWKGHEILLDALALIKDMPFICLFVGAADGKQAFIDRISRHGTDLGLEGRFRLSHAVDDMPAALMVADVVVMPSITPEPFGRISLEAQAMGRPVVAFDHGGAVESIKHGQTGWLATPGDAESLADCIRQALELQGSNRQVLADKSRTHIERNFSTTRMCNETVKIYRRILQKSQLANTG